MEATKTTPAQHPQAVEADPDTDADTVHEVDTENGNMDFMPEDLTIAVVDTARFKMSSSHNAIFEQAGIH